MKTIYIAGNFLSKSIGVRGAGEDLAEQLLMNGWKVITASSHPNRVLRLIDLLWTAIFHRQNYQIALVEVYSDLAFIWAEILCLFLRVLNKPYILTLHGGKLPEFAHKNNGRVKKLLRSAKKVTTPSQYLLHEFQTIRDDLQYLPNGFNLSLYPFCQRNHPKPKLIWLRAFHQIYNPSLAVEALRKISPIFPEVELTMIGPDKGDGTLDETLKRIDEYSLQEKVQITGAIPKNDVGKYLSKGDIYLNTTIYESFGVTVLEAAACGLCIVTTNVGELPYLWEDGVDALLVPPNDPDAITAAVKRILTEPGLAERLSTNARKKAEKYDWTIILPKWEKLLVEIMMYE